MSKRIYLLLTILAALPIFGAKDVLTIGTISATPGSTVTVPVYLRDVTGTALGGGAGAGNRIQGIMLQVIATPAVAGMTITFEPTGVLHGRTPLYQRGGSGRWIGSYSEVAQPLPFNTDAAGTGDRIGTLRVTLPSPLTGTPNITLAFNPETTMLSNQAGTVTESLANRHLQLVNGLINLSGAATSTTLTSTPNPSLSGSSVTFNVTVTSATTPINGSVIFTHSSQIIGSATVQNGQAAWTTSSLTPGTYNIAATYEGDATHLPSVYGLQHVVNLVTPTGVVATATSATSVSVSWLPSAGADKYEVLRKPAGGTYALLGPSTGPTYNDTTALASQTYFYVVRARTPGASSLDSAADFATTVTFTDNPLVAGTTTVKLAHLTELRTAIDAFRAAAGLGAATFEPSPSFVKQSDLESLRTALQQARSALGLSALTFTDAVPVTIKAVHFQELRTAVQ